MSFVPTMAGALSALLLAAVAGLWAPAAQADDHVILQLDWIPTGLHEPPFIGIKEGFFAAEHIDLEIRRGTGAADSLTKVATGTAQFGYTDIANLMSTPGTGVKAIMRIDFQVPHAVITRADTGIKGFAGLPGHSVGTAPTASSNLYFPLVMHDAGVDVSKITIVNVDPSALGPMLLTKRIDAAIMWTTNLPRLRPEATKAGIDLVPFLFSTVGLEMYGTVIIASEKTLAADPDLAKRFLRALRLSFLYSRDHPDETAAYVQSLNPQQNLASELAGLTEAQKYVFTWKDDEQKFGTFDPAKLKETYGWIVRALHADPAVDPESFVDRRFYGAG